MRKTVPSKITIQNQFDVVHRQNFGNARYLLNIVSVNNFNFEIMSLFEVLIETYKTGGPFFMFIITLLGLSMFFFAVKSGIRIFMKKDYSGKGLDFILMFGSLSFILGLLGQAIGMFQAFEVIQEAGDISPSLVAGGLRVSMITPLYGIFYFILSIPVWVIFREIVKKHR